MYIIETVCPFCGCVETVTVHPCDWIKYENGGLVQDCFPYLTASQRERLISGICSDCWDDMFKISSADDNDDDYYPTEEDTEVGDEEFFDDFDCDNDCGFDPYMGCFTDDC